MSLKSNNWIIGKCDECDWEDVFVYVTYDKNKCSWCISGELDDYREYETYDSMNNYENKSKKSKYYSNTL